MPSVGWATEARRIATIQSESPVPVIVYFGVEPADKAAVAKNVTLTSTPAVEGAWAWIQHDDGRWGLDYRTKDYWPAGTQIHLSAQLYGVQLLRSVEIAPVTGVPSAAVIVRVSIAP